MARLPSSVAVLAFLATGAHAQEPAWETVLDGPVVVKIRLKPGTAIKEVWAEGQIDAPVQDIQSVLLDVDNHSKFMPHVKVSRYLGANPEPDGSRYAYAVNEFPVVKSRDYVTRMWVEKQVGPDGSGEFLNRWRAEPGRLPERRNYVRVKHTEGSWHVQPMGPAKSKVTYRFSADPGGWIPKFALEMGHKQGVVETFRAVAAEAKKRAAARQAKRQP